MTLILVSCTEQGAIIASDTRLSWKGALRNDYSGKAGCLTFHDGRLLYAYTGLAEGDWGAFQTRRWLLSVMVERVAPWVAANDALLILKNKATEDFANLPVLKRIPLKDKRLSVAFAGYLGSQPVGAVLSNYENLAANTPPYPEAQDKFFLSCWSGVPGHAGWCCPFGAAKSMPEDAFADLERLVSTNQSLGAIKGKMQSVIVRASRGNKTIGANVLTATLSPNHDHLPTVGFTSATGADEILMLDQFHAPARLAFWGATLAAPDIVAPRAVRRHQAKRERRLRLPL
jgi:hypothetical protein